MKKLTLLTLFCALATGAMAGDGWNDAMTIFKHHDESNTNTYRIPAITATSQGTLIAAADNRYYGSTDLGHKGTGNKNQKVDFAIKVSHDGGNTWTEKTIVAPAVGNGVTDPSIVHDPTTGKTFLFGFQNDKPITDGSGNADFYVFTSEDGGLTWDNGTSIKNQALPTDKGYKYVFQGPGSGMVHNGTIYMATQVWHGEKTCSSGLIYSNDGGKTWEKSSLVSSVNGLNTSESNVFHHNGKIYMAVKNEDYDKKNPNKEENKYGTRVVYSTSDNGKTWQLEKEDFLQGEDIGRCETSTFALNDQVYIVGYSIMGEENWLRKDSYITTNTGRKIKIYEGDTFGYTSITQDQDNLYVLFEAEKDMSNKDDNGDIIMRRFDIASKEYANLNAQILDRGQSLLDVQGKLSSDQYVGGTYTNESESGAEAVVELNNFKIGAFHRNTKDNSDDVYRTIPYNLKETTLVLSQDNAFMQGDNIFAGYQAGKIEYSNKSTNDLTSFVMGYTFNKEFENDKTYTFALNGVYSNNKVERNKAEGVGRTAEFDSYSISMKNALSKNISFTDSSNLKLTAGLNTTVFGHDEFEEDGGIQTVDGGKWNNAKVDKSQNVSNEIFAKATLDQRVKLTDKSSVRLALDLGWEKELMDVDEWRDEFTVLDVEKEFATPVKKHEGGLGKAEVSATFDLAEKVELGVGYSMDTDGESTATGKVTYKL